MEFKNTAEALYIQAKEILDTIARIEEAEDMHSIELDLLLQKLRDIYDLVSDMKETFPKKNVEVISEPVKFDAEEEIAEPSDNRAASDEKIEKQDDSVNLEENSKKEESRPGKVSFISDRYKNSKPTLNEEMEGKSRKENLSTHLNLTPIHSISGAIGLNEKFELINELFAGDKNKFESTLEFLNKSDTFVEAYNYLNDNFDWDMDSVYVQRILELIRRKLIVRRNEQ